MSQLGKLDDRDPPGKVDRTHKYIYIVGDIVGDIYIHIYMYMYIERER
jgi:hypothetical protein